MIGDVCLVDARGRWHHATFGSSEVVAIFTLSELYCTCSPRILVGRVAPRIGRLHAVLYMLSVKSIELRLQDAGKRKRRETVYMTARKITKAGPCIQMNIKARPTGSGGLPSASQTSTPTPQKACFEPSDRCSHEVGEEKEAPLQVLPMSDVYIIPWQH